MSEDGKSKPRDPGANFCSPQNDVFYGAKVYRPLGKKEIRLARILPGKADDPIKIKLVQNVRVVQRPAEHGPRPGRFLDIAIRQIQWDASASSQIIHPSGSKQMPPGKAYFALSYSAGDVNDTTSIEVDGINFNVFRSIAAAIKQFKTIVPESSTIQIWIDQICIDQYNPEERGDQVAMMAEVYRSADQVWIWLGSGDGISGRQRALRPIFRGLACEFLQRLTSSLSFRGLNDYAEFKRLLSREGAEEWVELKSFFNSRWWSRCWVYQEAILAESAVFFFGDLAIEREVLCSAYIALVENTARRIFQTRPGESFERLLPISEMMSDPQFFNVYISVLQTGLIDLPTALRLSRASNCSDQRDRVYAMLGLVGYDYHIIPNYSVANTVSNVFITTTKKIIENHGTLDILGRAFPETRDSSLRLPSWVPDFSSREPLLNRPLLPDERPKSSLTDFKMNGKGPRFPSFKFLNDWYGNCILQCCIVPLGRVANKQDCISKCPTTNVKLQTHKEIEEDLQKSYSEEISTFIKRAGLVGVYQPTGESVEDALNSCLRLGTLNSLQPDPYTPDCEGRSTYLSYPHQGDKNDFVSVFVTPNHLLGLTMGGVRADDLLTVFAEANMPFIIRRADPCVGDQHHDLPQEGSFANYKLVGPVYLHGLDVSRILQDVRDGTLGSGFHHIRLR